MPPFGASLTSLQNPSVKFARSLHQRKSRYQERAFLVEGVRLVLDALRSGAIPLLLFLNPAQLGAHLAEVEAAVEPLGERVHPVTEPLISRLSDTESPQGVVAVFPMPEITSSPVRATAPLVVVADAIRDPGNLGTLIRSSVGAGASALVVTPETVDPFSPKVVRAAMGGHWRLPILRSDWHDPAPAILDCEQRLAADAGAPVAYDAVDWTHSSCLVVGSEAFGVTASARAVLTGEVAIPLVGGLESLNSAVAGSIILFEAARQRRTASQ